MTYAYLYDEYRIHRFEVSLSFEAKQKIYRFFTRIEILFEKNVLGQTKKLWPEGVISREFKSNAMLQSSDYMPLVPK